MSKIKVIAEVGVNHNGKENYIYKYIDTAKEIGADIVKFQIYNTQELVSRDAKTANYQILNNSKKISQFDLLKKYEINLKITKKIINYCKIKKIKPLFTAFDENSLKMLLKLGCKNFKVSSPDIFDYKLLYLLAKKNCKVFISSGMSNLNDIKNSILFLKKNGLRNNKIVLFHCTSSYPAQNSELNLNVLDLFKEKFDLEVGYSDHSLSQMTPLIAVAKGCKYLEKHITLNKKLTGPDHKASFDIDQFRKMINNLREAEIILGQKEKKIQKGEKENSFYVRKSLFAKNNIKIGEKFSLKNLTTKRPFSGVSSVKWPKYLGRKSKKNYLKGEKINE